jgi:thioredoxin-related protein
VNRLEEQYSPDIAFEYLNVRDDGIGEASFSQLGLRGHPSFVIFDAEGKEILRSLSILEEDLIIEVLDSLRE